MSTYILNKFISIIKVGNEKFYIKHSILSNISYVLEFDDNSKKKAEKLEKILNEGKIEITDLIEEETDESVNELVTFLLQENILVPEYSDNIDQYYHLVNSFGEESSIADKKILFVVSSEFIEEQIEHNLKRTNVLHDRINISQIQTIDLENYSIISVIYEIFSPNIFHKLNKIALEHGIPLQIAFLDGSTSYISPIFIKNFTVCYNEMEIQLESALFHKYGYLAYKNVEKSLPSYPSFMLNQVLFYSLHLALDFLISGKLKTKDRAIIFDLESLRYDLVDIIPLPTCPACKIQNKMTHDFL